MPYKTISCGELYWLNELCLLRDLNNVQCSPVSMMNVLFRTIFWAVPYRLNELCLLGHLNNDYAKQSLTQYHQWMPISRPSSMDTYHTNSKSSISQETWTVNAHTKVFPSVINEWPFHDNLPCRSIWLNYICFLRNLNNDHSVSLPVSPMNGHFKTTIWVHLYSLKELCPRRPKQQLCSLSPV